MDNGGPRSHSATEYFVLAHFRPLRDLTDSTDAHLRVQIVIPTDVTAETGVAYDGADMYGHNPGDPTPHCTPSPSPV